MSSSVSELLQKAQQRLRLKIYGVEVVKHDFITTSKPSGRLMHKKSKWCWIEEQDKNFKTQKGLHNGLRYFNPSEQILLNCVGISNYGVGSPLTKIQLHNLKISYTVAY